MYLQSLIVFALVFYRSDQLRDEPGSGAADWTLALAAAALFPLVTLAGTHLASRALLARLGRGVDHGEAHHRFHRATTIVKGWLLLGYASLLYLTSWPQSCYALTEGPWVRIFSDLLLLTPYLAGSIAFWYGVVPAELALREAPEDLPMPASAQRERGTRVRYVLLNFRFHVLTVALPMLLILMAANLTRAYGGWIRRELVPLPIGPDLVLGFAAFLVFLASPMLLRHVWTTRRLESGPLRSRLEVLCQRIGLRCRDILVWKSDGMMINAAVMGLIAPVRFVLLSDGLLQSMSVKQIEAVFGHEAGHVRRRHVEFFLLFAFVAMLAVSGVLELLLHLHPALSSTGLEGAGVVLTALVWGLGFGRVSRQFEREADWFGSRCVTPVAGECAAPCAVHPSDGAAAADALCSTAAGVFSSALDRVALLNGIEHDDFSWRHSSIGSRMRFLAALSSDARKVREFRSALWRMKAGLLAAAVLGGGFALHYVLTREPLLLQPGAM